MKSPLSSPPPRTPGQGVEAHRSDLLIDGLATYFFVPAMLWILTALEFRAAPRTPGTYLVLALVATVVGAVGLIRLRRRLANLKLGRDGEREVAHVLSTLDIPGTRIFHDVLAEGFNLDHVVVCDRGIYVIETKTWRKPDKLRPTLIVQDGRIHGAGWATDKPVRQAMGEAAWLADRLRSMTGRGFHIQPVVVTPGWYVKEPLDVGTRTKAWVLNPRRLLGYVHNDPVRLKPEEVCLVADQLGVLVRKEDAVD